MDYLNERYHRKRALYLAYIAQALLEADFVENLEFTYQDDCHLKPVLLITPKGKMLLHFLCNSFLYNFFLFLVSFFLNLHLQLCIQYVYIYES